MVISSVSSTFSINTSHSGLLSLEPLGHELQTQIEVPIPCSLHGHQLPCHQVTNFLDLPALRRRQPPYMVLRFRCSWLDILCFILRESYIFVNIKYLMELEENNSMRI
ncbi:hypothetical protein BRARA_F02726 [Brassica rapa]|uniref:Uncharacterized protein n=1 Tax=Brassica campestris TaxID=3711 RepID=A0A397Z218_BRACM|nr:hypothetical protein BRARA_F02726 [Brassica rapa]